MGVQAPVAVQLGTTFLGVPREIDVAIATAAERNLTAALKAAPWLQSVARQSIVIANSSAGTAARYERLRALSDRVNMALKPHSACRRGCNHCCHIGVVISEFEAKRMGAALGLQPKRDLPADAAETAANRFKGVACTFLASGGGCRAYEHRPIQCRAHFNMAEDESMCALSVPSEESTVAEPDLRVFWLANAKVLASHRYADIRDFFGACGQ